MIRNFKELENKQMFTIKGGIDIIYEDDLEGKKEFKGGEDRKIIIITEEDLDGEMKKVSKKHSK